MLRYDFQMYPADGAFCQSEAGHAKALTNQGQARSNKVVAFFRDPTTKEAVTSAPPIVRLFLEEAGFELSHSNAGKHDSEDVPSDYVLRRTLAAQLTAALSNRALKKALARAAHQTEFDVAAFISAVVSKETPEPQPQNAAPHCTIVPRRPNELRAAGIKSRTRPS